MSDEGFISRWSRRKLQAKVAPEAEPLRPNASVIPAQAGTQPVETAETRAPDPLPPIESLTPDSDFTPFMEPHVDADTRRAAMKRLFQDPRHNVMDGLDVYIDDYSKPDPLPEGWLEKMTQMSRLGEYREPDPKKESAPDENDVAAKVVAEKTAATSQEGVIPAKAPPPDTPDAGSDAAPLVK